MTYAAFSATMIEKRFKVLLGCDLNIKVVLKVATVEGFINSVDSQMRQRQEQQKLATISARIDSYETVEGSSEEVEKVRTIYCSSTSSVFCETLCFFILFCRSSRSTTALILWFP